MIYTECCGFVKKVSQQSNYGKHRNNPQIDRVDIVDIFIFIDKKIIAVNCVHDPKIGSPNMHLLTISNNKSQNHERQ